jgi:plastocyanin
MRRSKILAASFAVGLLFAAGCSKEPEQKTAQKPEPAVENSKSAPVASSGSGTISGKVVFKGSHSASKLAVGKDKEVCGDAKQDPSVLVGADGGLKNAVVQIAGLNQGKTPSKEALFDQSKCEYVPHVLVVPVGATVTIKNSDGILHNVHTQSQVNTPFNRAQPKFLKEIKEQFAKPEIISVRCDVHGWMSGWIVVTDNSYFDVTRSDGAFTLADVPAGKYSLEVWHETLGSSVQQVDLKSGETVNVTFEFQMKK